MTEKNLQKKPIRFIVTSEQLRSTDPERPMSNQMELKTLVASIQEC